SHGDQWLEPAQHRLSQRAGLRRQAVRPRQGWVELTTSAGRATMKIVVIGGTGLIGSKTARRLRERGPAVMAASPNAGVDTSTGKGLSEALKGAEVVVDLANSPSFADEDVLTFFRTSGQNLIAAEKAAGVKHHVALSVVGTARLQESGYFRGK